ncbi:hypothetical protein [Schlesneria sp. DSM 10557]|uniref:hypothetical protein n=1 Tax=Schlesneria sp. DSM 10557 TaxID=3044399 RepID=UPI00359FFF59
MTLTSRADIRKRTIIAAVLLVVAVGVLFLLLCLGMRKENFSTPSRSVSGARWSGVLLKEIALTPTVADQVSSFLPKEAWVESVIEYPEGFSLFQQSIAGSRFCVRVNKSLSGSPTASERITMKINGNSSPYTGGFYDSAGVTINVPLDPDEELPDEGYILFNFKKEGKEIRFSYKVKQ